MPRISNAASGPPVSARGINEPLKARSTATLIIDSAMPPPMQTSGQNHMLVWSQWMTRNLVSAIKLMIHGKGPNCY